ncbi:hypothetical protein SEPCBS119000_001251 [Sporothrix epigloea]|uniref:Mus7/MMS22 family protein n=1 Tax=Sporothrix epigloea TaxID=1892477 RepID=A0ABP0DAT8_9PEZI
MARNWQRLGEVPDSDEEEVDSQELREDTVFDESTTIDGFIDELSATQDPRPLGGRVLEVLLSPRREAKVAKPKSLLVQHEAQSSPSHPQAQPPAHSRPFFLFDDSEDELNLVSNGSQYGRRDPLPSSPPPLNDSTPPRNQGQPDVTDGMILEKLDDDEVPPERPHPSPPTRPLRRSQGQPKSPSTQPTPTRPSSTSTPHKSQSPAQSGRLKRTHEVPVLADPFSFSPASTLSSLSKSPSPVPDSHLPHASGEQVVPQLSPPFPDIPDSPPEFRLGFLRSLRPRKPIQQHPYLLEGAQYAQAMKSHGVKPVRPEYISNQRKSAVDENSQDQEFSLPVESQLPSRQQTRVTPSADDSLYDFPSSQAELVGQVTPRISLPSTPTPAQQVTPFDSQPHDLSLPSEDEVPTTATSQLQRYKRLQSKAAKRQSLSKSSSAAKRAKILNDILNDAPRPKWIPVRMDSSPDQPPHSDVLVRPVSPGSPTPVPCSPPHEISVISDDEESFGENDDAAHAVEVISSPPRSDAEGSLSDSEAVRKNSRRIKAAVLGPPTTKNQTQPVVGLVPSAAAPLHPPNIRIKMAARIEPLKRPAQLETRARKVQSTAGFISKKKELDEMYRRRRRDAVPLPNVRLEQFIDDQATYTYAGTASIEDDCTPPPSDFRLEQQRQPTLRQCDSNGTATPKLPRARQRTKHRKSYVPRQVDTTAPRFARALDPIPVDIGSVTVDYTIDNTDPGGGKLRGLGPFGSQYTQHFDIFPLDSDIAFHQSTLIGSGRLSLALGILPTDESEVAVLPSVTSSFQLDERTLCWTSWDEVSSSELGITMDWLADTLLSLAPASISVEMRVHTLVEYLVDFIQHTLSTQTSPSGVQKAFVQRTVEIVKNFMARFETSSFQQGDAAIIFTNSHLAALTGIVVIVSWLLQICRNSSECGMLLFQVEDLLRAACKLSAKALLVHGLDDIRNSYADLQRSHSHICTIRRDKQAFYSWVILIQVLEHAKIPRAGFWDVAYSVMLANTPINTCTGAGVLEKLWEDMFTLLPLGEFDSTGAVRPGIRHVLPLDGWELPKKALERVFQLYKANPHQSPSFNAYCRAIVGRCHYLVQAWGWRRCKTIVGTIFDFYGSQGFAHLRNEEAHKSPRFLEQLASSPSLAIEPDDKCFHIFIKMLGLILQQMKRLGQTKEMTNLVSRILPNHDRQYLKEKDVHERDLAALRNHHDLLCTLYWASTPDIRPPLHQIEKLVVPANSHKEACLINIRAWKQLAQFVIATDEGFDVYRGFHSWMRNIFQQTLDQYLSAESDMHRQFQNLFSPMMQGISPDMMQAMAAANRASAMEVLHSCVVASLDVLRYAKSLSVATYCFNCDQLIAVFTQLDLPDPKTNWRILSTALDALDHYSDRLEKAMDEQYSSAADIEDPQVADDAVLMLDHRLAKDFFRFNRTITHMSWDALPQPAADARNLCTERSIAVAARLVGRFVHSGVYGLSRFFGTGDYCIFERLPHAPGLLQRKFVPLFVSALIRSNVFDFKDLGTSLLELWMMAIVKPQRFLAYEHRLAEVLKQHDLPYVRQAHIPSGGQAPNYHTNGLFFDCVMTSLRQQLQDADGTARRQQLRSDFARALKLVMQQMKGDLKFAKAQPVEHEQYIVFVRYIVALIRSHGSDICPLDSFFYEQSPDFSPSPEDPQLRAASIVMYGLRLGEGEVTAAPQLFHYLLNNFNIALANDRLDQECKFLERSMENDNVLGFMLERMLPAILRATSQMEEAWPLLNVYYSAMEQLLTRSPVPKDIGDENTTGGVVGLLHDIVAWLQWAALTLAADAAAAGVAASDAVLSGGDAQKTSICMRLHAMAQLIALANLLQPLLMVCSCLPCPPATQARLDRAISGFSQFIELALADIQVPANMSRRRYVPPNDAVAGHGDVNDQPRRRTLFSTFLKPDIDTRTDPDGSESTAVERAQSTTNPRQFVGASNGSGDRSRVDEFSRKILQNVRDNWTVKGTHLTARSGIRHGAGESAAAVGVQAATVAESPAGSASTGVPFGPWSMGELLSELQRQAKRWKLCPVNSRRPRRQRMRMGLDMQRESSMGTVE